MKTIKQHVIPRCYLKHFENKNGLVYTYNVKAKKFLETNINNVCYRKYAYETSRNNVDNKLENELAKLERNLTPYIDTLISKSLNGTLERQDVDNYCLFKYIMLLHIRTDSNRILFTRARLNFESMDHHMNLNELEKNEVFLKLFNTNFKGIDKLSKTLDFWYNKNKPEIRIGISKDSKFITSDNPVITYYFPNEMSYDFIKFIMPIHPQVCIYFFGVDKVGVSKEKQTEFPYIVQDETVYGYNQGIVNVANYWIISSEKFSVLQNNSIYNRFK